MRQGNTPNVVSTDRRHTAPPADWAHQAARAALVGIAAIAAVMLLSNCTMMSAGNMEKNYEFPRITNSGPGNVIIYVTLDADTSAVMRSRDMQGSTDTAGSLGMDGGQGSLVSKGGEVLLDDITNVVEKWLDNRPITTTTTTTPPPVVVPVTPTNGSTDPGSTVDPGNTENGSTEGGETDTNVGDEVTGAYEVRFHHTQTGGVDGGKALVLCPGQKMEFENCSSGSVRLPRHLGADAEATNREHYWNLVDAPEGDIVCVKDGQIFRYLADEPIVFGRCE